MQSTESGSKPDILNSWKEIAVYLGRGVRTVQRWEANLGLPVHRPNGHTRSSVIALRRELDEWLRQTPQLGPAAMPSSPNRDRVIPQSILECRKLRQDCLASMLSFQKTAEIHLKLVGALVDQVGELNRVKAIGKLPRVQSERPSDTSAETSAKAG